MKLGAKKRLSTMFNGRSAKAAIGLLGLTAVAAFSAVLPAGAAGAATSTTGLNDYVFWNAPPSFVNISQDFTIDNLAPTTFWSTMFSFTNQNYGGYIGIQTNGNVSGQQTSGDAIFSLWNAVAWHQVPKSSATCQSFGNEGTGGSCRAPFSVVAGHTYNVNVVAFGNPTTIGKSKTHVQWWAGKVTDETTKKSTVLGLIASTSTSLTQPANFVEDFSIPNVAGSKNCDAFPLTKTTFFAPNVIVSGGHSTAITYSGGDPRICEQGTIVTGTTSGNKGTVNLIVGGPNPS